MESCRRLWTQVNRRKRLESVVTEGPLRRCLGTVDLVLLGLGQMIGAGIFVLTGAVMLNMTGPAVMLSYVIAGIGCFLSALCYAEFAAKVPLAGSAYSYTYVTIGEVWAFAIGWNMLLEYIIGVSSSASALSGTLDSIFNNVVYNFTANHVGTMSGSGLAEVPDFLAFFLIIFLAIFVSAGVKVGTIFNNVMNIVTISGILFVTILAFSRADINNWTNKTNGGFLPFGFKGVMGGAATCFYAYVGFDSVAAAGEEAKNPKKSLPIAISVSILCAVFLYVLASTSLSLLVPYNMIEAKAPFPMAFDYLGISWAKYCVAIVSVLAITCTSYVSLYTVPRTIYAMATDGLLFEVLARVNERTQTPLITISLSTLISATLALLLDLNTLVELLSIGTLFAYTMVSACVIILRYQPVQKEEPASLQGLPDDPEETIPEETDAISEPASDLVEGDKLPIIDDSRDQYGRLKFAVKNLPILRNCLPGRAVSVSVIVMAVLMAALFGLCWYGSQHIASGQWWAITLLIVLIPGIVLCFLVFVAHERNDSYDTFMVPLVPLLPAVSIMFNVLLMLKLEYQTWIRAAVWLAIGFVIYFTYGLHHSRENRPMAACSRSVSYGAESQGGPSTTVTEVIQPKQEVKNPASDE